MLLLTSRVQMRAQQILNCSFSSWYPKFKDVTWESIIIPLSKDFLDYLQTDGLFLLPPENSAEAVNEQQNEDDDGWDSSESVEVPRFPELNKQIQGAIIQLGGAVFPKLNWSCPKDATWISFDNSMKCVTPNDVYLLLKSSDFISHDLTQPFKDCDIEPQGTPTVTYDLVLRKWVNLNPSMEFRCFVKENCLIGICQRDITNYYSYIGQQRNKIVRDISLFFVTHIRDVFVDANYVFDVYRQQDNDILLIDFNPFCKTTDDLLFDWDSLLNLDDESDEPEFRFITEGVGVQPSPYRVYSIPKDVVDIANGCDSYKLLDLLKLQANQSVDD